MMVIPHVDIYISKPSCSLFINLRLKIPKRAARSSEKGNFYFKALILSHFPRFEYVSKSP